MGLIAPPTSTESGVTPGFVGRIPVRNLWLLMLYASDLFRTGGTAHVAVEDRLVARDIADRSNGGVARLSGALGDRIGDGEDLCGLLIKKQVIVPEVGSGDVPVEIFCLQVNRVAVRERPAIPP